MTDEDVKSEIKQLEERIAALRHQISEPVAITWAAGLQVELSPFRDGAHLRISHVEMGATVVHYEQRELILMAFPHNGDTPVLSLSFERERLLAPPLPDDGSPLAGYYVNARHQLVQVVSETDDMVRFTFPGTDKSAITLRKTFLSLYAPHPGPAYWPVMVDTDWLRLAVPAYSDSDHTAYFERQAASYLVGIIGTLSYDAEIDAFVVGAGTPDPKVYPAQEILVQGIHKTVYALGAGLWHWKPVPKDE